jgi:hypothetical protein
MTKVKIERIASGWKGFAFCSRPCRVVFIGAFVVIIMMMNIIVDASIKNLIPLEKKSKKVDDGFVPPPRNETPSWTYVYEPGSISYFWKSPNRMFARSLFLFLASSEASSKSERGATIRTARSLSTRQRPNIIRSSRFPLTS